MKPDSKSPLQDALFYRTSVLDSILEGISILDKSFRVLMVNSTMKQWYHSNLPLEGKKCFEVYHNATEPCKVCPTRRAFKSGEKEVDIVPGLPGSEVEWLELFAYPVKDEKTGDVTTVVEFVRDVTERIRTNRKLQDIKNQFEALFQHSSDCVFLHDLEGNILEVNRKTLELFGYSREEFSKLNVRKIHPEDQLEKSKQAFREIREKGNVEFEIDFRKKSGEIFPGEVKSTLITLGDREVIQAIVRDITERKKAEEESKKNTQRLEILYELSRFRSESIQELLDFALHSAIDLTDSKIGYIYFYDEESETFTLNSWSEEVMEECKVTEPQTTYLLSKTGIWGEVVRQRKPIMLNDFRSNHPLKKGYPEGHVSLKRWMAIPVFWNDIIVATVGVANKDTDYTQQDVQRLVLLMDSVWKIVEQQRVNQALYQSEERYRAIVENSADAIYLLVSNRFEMINKRFTEIFGYTIEDLNSPDFDLMNLYAPESLPLIEERTRKLEEGKPVEPVYEFIALGKDGRRIYCETSVSYIQYGETVATQGIIRDITERKLAEQKIRDAHQRLVHFIEQTPLGVIEWDTDFRVTEWNRAAEKIFGYTRAEALGKHAAELVIPEDLNNEISAIWKALLTQTGGERSTNENVTRDGRRITCAWYNSPLIDRQGKVFAVASLVEDITERVQAKEALIESERRFRSLFDGASDAIIIIANTGEILEVNQTACNQFGYGKSEFVGKNLNQLCSKEHFQLLEQKIDELIEKGAHTFELDFYKKDSSQFPAEVKATFTDFRGSRTTMLSLRDLTERKKLQEQLYQSQKMESVGRLAGGVAHDFNNILSVITGYSSLILDTLKKDDPLYQDIKEIYDAADRASRLTNQLLAFSRKQILEPEILNINEVISNLDKMLRRVIGEDISLFLYLDEDINPIQVDRGNLEQVIINLAVNARDAMPSGGKLTIETNNIYLDEEYSQTHPEVQPGSYVLTSISDTGIGMTQEIREKIFEPFFTTKGVGQGTGLGLATVYGIVKQSGGFIYVYSEPGEGTVFKIYFPTTSEKAEETSEKISTKVIHGTETILVTEDDENVRRIIERTLSQYGYRIFIASSGEEALQIASNLHETIDLLCTDVVMPDMNGKELSDKFLRIHPEARVLFMSGYTDNMIVHHGILKKGVNFINKPFSPGDLLRKIRSVLG